MERVRRFPAARIQSREKVVIAWLLIVVLVILGFLCIPLSSGNIDRRLHC